MGPGRNHIGVVVGADQVSEAEEGTEPKESSSQLSFILLHKTEDIQRKEREFWALEMPLNTFLDYKARGKSSEDIKSIQ